MRCILRSQRGEDHAGGLSVHFGTHALCSSSCNAAAQASGLEFEQILKDKLAQLGCDIYDGAFFDEVCAISASGACACLLVAASSQSKRPRHPLSHRSPLTRTAQVHLKHAGMHKTPDILLTIPICVKGKAVHWIDSKVWPAAFLPLTSKEPQLFVAPFAAHTVAQAMFCDVTRFELMYKRQLGGYEARYGAG
jgi:hypothetical protein